MPLSLAGSLTAVKFPCPGELPLNLNRIERFPEVSKGRNPNPSKPNIDKPYIEVVKNMFRLRQSFQAGREYLFLNQVNSPLRSLEA
jgi:hypothetical protein